MSKLTCTRFMSPLLIVLAMSLSGCESPDRTDTRETIIVQMFEGPEFDAMQPTVAYWNEHYADETRIEVEVVKLDRVGYMGKMHTQLLAGLSQPDIVHPYSLQIGEIEVYLEPLAAFLDDEELMTPPGSHEKLSIEMAFEPAMDAICMADDEILMLPKDMSEVVLYYRKDLIPDPPETWDEFVAVSKQFTRSLNAESPTKYGAVLGGKYEIWTFCAALENLWPYGASMFDETKTSSNLLQAGAEAGLMVYEELARSGAIPPDSANAEYPEVAAIIQSGDVAMAMQWNAMYGSLTDPELSPGVFDKFAIAPPPGQRLSDGTINRNMFIQTIGLAINKNSEHKRAAFRFMAWACLGEGAMIYAEAGGSSPIDAVWNADEVAMPYKVLAPWALEFGRAVPHHPRLPELMMIGASWVQRVMVGNSTSSEALSGMHDEMNEIIHER